MIVLGNTRIVKPNIFNLAKAGCLNIHPGLLPQIKGAFPQVWSIINDHPIGCTSHLIDENIDTGPIILRRECPVNEDDTLESIILKTMYLSAQLQLETLKNYSNNKTFDFAPSQSGGNYYPIPDKKTVELARERLATKQYQATL